MELKTKIQQAVDFIKSKQSKTPQVALVLGSGLGKFADELKNPVAIDYSDIPHFPVSTVEGHAGKLVIGESGGKMVIAMQGRFHYYEGYSMEEVTFPVRVMTALGIESLIITNACGALNRNYRVGDLMIMTDHINQMGDNPLIGKNDTTLGTRFPPMQGAYTPSIAEQAMKICREISAPVHRGVYIAVTGPNYETAAELRAFKTMGADVVGMSTVPEVIVAVHGGIKKILGISCVTDMATGEGYEDVNHEDVIAAAAAAQPYFLELVRKMIERL